MARLLAQFRPQHVTRQEKKLLKWSKPLLVEALRNVQTICPPRVSKQSKAYLERIVRGALDLDDNHPIKLAMQRAISDARNLGL